MTYRVRNIGLAIGLAIVACLLVLFYVSNYRRNIQQAEEAVKVYVAAIDIPAGTAGSDVVDESMLEIEEVPRRSVAPGAVSAPDEIKNLVAADPIYAGEQLSTRRFTKKEQTGIRAQIGGTARVFQLPGDQHQLLAGTLKAGDRIDVVASIKYKVEEVDGDGAGGSGARDRVASRVVLRDLLVLEGASPPIATTKITNPTNSALAVMLAVSDSQAQKLFFVLKNGDWSLQLRPTDDASDSPESVETVESVLGDGLKPSQFEQLIFGFSRASASEPSPEGSIDEQP